MIIITNDNKELYPVLFGSYETPEYCEFITCIEQTDNVDLFGEQQKIKVHISEIKAIKGTYSFPPFYAKEKRNTTGDKISNTITKIK